MNKLHCTRTPYASEREVNCKIMLIMAHRKADPYTHKSTRQYHASHCFCGLWHLSARNGKG